MPRLPQRASGLFARFGRDKSANIAVIFGIAVIPILTAVGAAIDYSMATRIQAKLQTAADAASIASIATNSAGYKAAALMTSDGSVSAGVTEMQNIFNGNVATIPNSAGLSVSVTAATVTKTGTALNSTISFTAHVPVTFMKAIGWQTMTIGGTSKSSSSLPMYLDFYLTLDVSGSMGLPSTTAEAVRMQNINPDNNKQYPTGCTLACHFAKSTNACTDSGTQKYPTGNYCMGYEISRNSQIAYAKLLQNHGGQLPLYKYSNMPSSLYSSSAQFPNDPVLSAVASCPTDGTDACIQLRLDAVGYAVTQLFTTANSVEKVSNEFRVGVSPFIRFLNSNYFPLTSTINGNPNTPGTINYAAANLASLLDTNQDASLGSGGTHIDTALNSMNTLITSVGDGSASNKTLPYVFLVTDGAQDPQVKGVPNGGWSGSNHATVIDPTAECQTLKSRGIKVSVLYIPYQPINPVNASFAGDEDDAANNNIPSIPGSLQGCASPPDAAGSYFYTATSPTEIQTSLNAMFNHAVQTAHITN
jgi:Flp pilus assembly protein TadG